MARRTVRWVGAQRIFSRWDHPRGLGETLDCLGTKEGERMRVQEYRGCSISRDRAKKGEGEGRTPTLILS